MNVSVVLLRDAVAAPRAIRVPDGVGSEEIPSRTGLSGVSEGLARGGEADGRERLTAWLRAGITSYEEGHDDPARRRHLPALPASASGTLSPVELVHRARAAGGPGAEVFVRRLAWRGFHHQVLAARPDAATADYRTRHDRWRSETGAREDIDAWKEGLTGYPVVDAATRQLRYEGWTHNRGRLLTANFLSKTRYVHWRVGARHFLDLLVDGDIANNQLNWQWMAGTGTDARPHRVHNPVTQAERYDPNGEYVRRWVPQLAGLARGAVHEPWKLRSLARAAYDCPDPIVELSEGPARFRAARDHG